jgi:hypothetical protein
MNFAGVPLIRLTRHRIRRSRGLVFLALAIRTLRVPSGPTAPLQTPSFNVVTRPLAVHRLLTHRLGGWRALPTTKKSGAPMTYGYIEDLKFAVEVFDERGNLKEVLGRLHDLDAARAAYDACRAKFPKKLLYLCQGGRILRRSDRDEPEGSVIS